MRDSNVRNVITIGATAGTVSVLLVMLNVPLLVSCGLGAALFYILTDRLKESRR